MNLSFSDPKLESISAMVDDAISTSINLRDAQLHQFPKFSLERRFSQINFDVIKTLQCRTEQLIHLRLLHSRRNGGYRSHTQSITVYSPFSPIIGGKFTAVVANQQRTGDDDPRGGPAARPPTARW